MKKFLLIAASVLLVLSMLVGCDKSQAEAPIPAEPSTTTSEPPTTPTGETATEETEGDTANEIAAEQESDTSSASAYAKQIERYYTAISNQWNEGAYFDQEMSAMAAYYYEGNALENIGFTYVDLDGDNSLELIIGAIQNAQLHPLVFEIWTLKDGEPVMLAQSGSRNRYYTQYAEEDNMWSIANEGENGAANHAVYYLYLSEGKFEVIQGIVFDAIANETDPWFIAYDLDWDVSNDIPIDENTANAVMEAGRNIYTPMEYIPYSQYK